MKRIMFIVCAAAIAMSMNACISKKQKPANNVVVVQEVSGIYTGTLPCADCPGIWTRVDINSDLMTYTLQTRYINKSDETFTSSGKFSRDADGTLTFDNQLLGQCLIENNAIYGLVDSRKKDGKNAENYILMKVDLNLVEKYWKLLELHGNPITPANNAKEAHIIFHIDGNRFSGDAGCNRLMGSYQTKEHNRIVLSSAATTMMMCIDMETETNFLQVLDTADSYWVQNDTLTLNLARMAPLAKFVAVYLR